MPGDDLPLFAAMPATIGDALASLNREHFVLSFHLEMERAEKEDGIKKKRPAPLKSFTP